MTESSDSAFRFGDETRCISSLRNQEMICIILVAGHSLVLERELAVSSESHTCVCMYVCVYVCVYLYNVWKVVQ